MKNKGLPCTGSKNSTAFVLEKKSQLYFFSLRVFAIFQKNKTLHLIGTQFEGFYFIAQKIEGSLR